jgi:predicted regulator of Ras-like GTPase activity (Roadblock/LC7/MglB family)
MLEIIFYGTVFYFIRPRSSLLQLLAGAGLTFLYRIMLGTVFGTLIAILYKMDFSVSLTLGVSKYLPAIFLHIIVAPFIMRPFFLAIASDQETKGRRPFREDRAFTPAQEEGRVAQPFRPQVDEQAPVSATPVEDKILTGADKIIVSHDTNGFERAVKYLGEHRAVLLATVVDYEGLVLASFNRHIADPNLWSAYSLVFQQINKNLLDKNGKDHTINNIDLTFDTDRLTIMKVENFNLLVLSNNEEDKLLGIRITQAADIIRKYTSERYGKLLSKDTEEQQYVSST